MKKICMIIVSIIGVIALGILLDSIQALVLNNNPLIGVKTKCRSKRGIFVETYYCDNNKKITKMKKNSCQTEEVCTNYLKEEQDKKMEKQINKNLNKMMEVSDNTSSNPYDYIKNEYYDNILNLGEDAIPIILKMYDEKQLSGIKAYISAIAVQDISGCNLYDKYQLEWSTGEDFFDLWKDNSCNYYPNTTDENQLTLKEESLTSKGATFILKNNTEKEYGYGPEYYLEQKENGKWHEVETLTKEPLTWNSISYIIKGNEEKELNIDWSFGYGELKVGEYRLVKTTYREEDRPITEFKRIYLYTNFTIQ